MADKKQSEFTEAADLTGGWFSGHITGDNRKFPTSLVAPATHQHPASDSASGTFADARISESSVVQHNGALDHGTLIGLADDDHLIYMPIDGSRSIDTLDVIGDITVGGTVDGRDVAADGALTDAAYAAAVTNATDAATASRIVLRDASGRAKVADPSASGDIANKGFCDSTYQPLDGTLTALAALNNTVGFLKQTGADTFTRDYPTADDVGLARGDLSSKTTPVGADELPIYDSAASYAVKRATVTSLLGGASIRYLGTWNANTNTPTLSNGSGTQGDEYKVSVAGSTSLDGISSWAVGDELIRNATVWTKVPAGTPAAASAVTFTPTGTVAATDVQAAIAEVASEAAPAAGSSSIVTVGTVTAGNVTAVVSAASDTLAGKVELATTAETTTGTDTVRAVTPAGDKAALNAFTGTSAITTVGTLVAGNVDAAVTNASTTAAGKVELATNSEALAGTATGGSGAALVVTPPALVNALSGYAVTGSNLVVLTVPLSEGTLANTINAEPGAVNRLRVDLTQATRVKLGLSLSSAVGSSGQVAKLQYSADQTTWTDLGPSIPINGTGLTAYESAWGVPATTTNTWIRLYVTGTTASSAGLRNVNLYVEQPGKDGVDGAPGAPGPAGNSITQTYALSEVTGNVTNLCFGQGIEVGTTITAVRVRSLSGTCTVALKRNDTSTAITATGPVTSWAVTTTTAEKTMTAGQTLNADGLLYLTVTSASALGGLLVRISGTPT